MSLLEKCHTGQRGSMQGHRKYSDGFSDTSSCGSFMDDTDREVSNLTDRAFRSLCIGEEAIYNDSEFSSSPTERHKAFAEETQQKTASEETYSYSIQKYGETEAQPEMASTFQHSYVDVTHQEQAFREGSLPYMNNGSNEVTWQQGRSSSRVSSLIKAFSAGECYRDSGTCDIILARDRYRDFGSESWDKSTLLSIQRELSDFSENHHNFKLGSFQSYRNNFYASEMASAVGQMDTTVLMKTSKSKLSMNSTNCFFHSEFSPFQLWEEYNKFTFESTKMSGFMSANEFPRWYDSPMYKELKDNNRVPNSLCENRRLSQRQIQDVVASQRSRSTLTHKASAIEKRCESEIASNYPPWKKNNNFVRNKPVNRPSTVSPSNERTCRPDSNLFSNSKATHEIVVESTLPSSVTPFSITQLLTPVIHLRQETETSEILQFAHTPSVSDYSSQNEADPKLQTDVQHLRDSYKSKASSLLFNLKDNRKRVKSTYSPTRFKGLEITDRNKQTSKLEGRESRFSDILVSQETAHENLSGTDARASCNSIREPSAALNTLKDYTDGFGSYDNLTLNSPQIQERVANYKSVHGSSEGSEGHSPSRDSLANVGLSTHNLSAQHKSYLTSEGQLKDLNYTFSPARPEIANMHPKAYPPTHSLPAQTSERYGQSNNLSQNDVQQRKDFGRKTWDKFDSVNERDDRFESGPFRGEIAALIEMDKQRKATAKQYSANDNYSVRKETYMQKVNEDIKLGRLSKEEAKEVREDSISPRKTSYSDSQLNTFSKHTESYGMLKKQNTTHPLKEVYGGLQSLNVTNDHVKAPEQNVSSNSMAMQKTFDQRVYAPLQDHKAQKNEELYSYQPYKYEHNKQWHMSTSEDRHTKESMWMQKKLETMEQTDAKSYNVSNTLSTTTEFVTCNGAPKPRLQDGESASSTDTSDQNNSTKQDRFSINDILAIRDNEQARRLKDNSVSMSKSENSQSQVKLDAAEKLTTTDLAKEQEQQGYKVQEVISPSPGYIRKEFHNATNISNDRKDRIMSKDTEKATTRAMSYKERGQSKQEILTSKLKAHAQKEISAIKEKGLARQGILARNTTKPSMTINNEGQEGHSNKKEITADKLNHLFQDITYSSVTQYKEQNKTQDHHLNNESPPSTEKEPPNVEDNQKFSLEMRNEKVKRIPLTVDRQNDAHPADDKVLMKETFSHVGDTIVSDMINNAQKDYQQSRISEDRQMNVTSSEDINANKESVKQSHELMSGHVTTAHKPEKCTSQNSPVLYNEKHDQKENLYGSNQSKYTEKALIKPADTTKKDFTSTEASKSTSGLNKNDLLGLERNKPRVEELNVHHKSKIDAAVEQPKIEPIKNSSEITASQLTSSSSDMKFKNGIPPAKPLMESAKSELTSNLQTITLSADVEQLVTRTYKHNSGLSSDSEASSMEITAKVKSMPTNNPGSQRIMEPETLKCVNNKNGQALMIKNNTTPENVLFNQQNNPLQVKANDSTTANQIKDNQSSLGTSKESLTQMASVRAKENCLQKDLPQDDENTKSLLRFNKEDKQALIIGNNKTKQHIMDDQQSNASQVKSPETTTANQMVDSQSKPGSDKESLKHKTSAKAKENCEQEKLQRDEDMTKSLLYFNNEDVQALAIKNIKTKENVLDNQQNSASQGKAVKTTTANQKMDSQSKLETSKESLAQMASVKAKKKSMQKELHQDDENDKVLLCFNNEDGQAIMIKNIKTKENVLDNQQNSASRGKAVEATTANQKMDSQSNLGMSKYLLPQMASIKGNENCEQKVLNQDDENTKSLLCFNNEDRQSLMIKNIKTKEKVLDSQQNSASQGKAIESTTANQKMDSRPNLGTSKYSLTQITSVKAKEHCEQKELHQDDRNTESMLCLYNEDGQAVKNIKTKDDVLVDQQNSASKGNAVETTIANQKKGSLSKLETSKESLTQMASVTAKESFEQKDLHQVDESTKSLLSFNKEDGQALLIKDSKAKQNIMDNQQSNASQEKSTPANQMVDSRSKPGSNKESLKHKTSAKAKENDHQKEPHKDKENTKNLVLFDKKELSKSQNMSRIIDSSATVSNSQQVEKRPESAMSKQKELPRPLEISKENNNHKTTKESQEKNPSNSEPKKAIDKLEPNVSSQHKVKLDEGATQKDNTKPVSTQNVESTAGVSNIIHTPSKVESAEEPMIYNICVSSKTEAASDDEPMIYTICVSSKCHIDEQQNSVKQEEESSVETEISVKDDSFRIENDRAENEPEVVRRKTEVSSNVEEKEDKIGKCELTTTMNKSNVMGRITTSYEDLLAKYGLPASDYHGHLMSKRTQEERERKEKEDTETQFSNKPIKHGITKPLTPKEKSSGDKQTHSDDSRQASSQKTSITSQPLKEAEGKIKQLQHCDIPSNNVAEKQQSSGNSIPSLGHSTSDTTLIPKDINRHVEQDRVTQNIEPSSQSRGSNIQSKEKKVEEQVRNSEKVQSMKNTGNITDDVSRKSTKKTDNESLMTKQSVMCESTRAAKSDVLKASVSNTSLAKDTAKTKLTESKIPKKTIPQAEKKLEEVEGKEKMFNQTDTLMLHPNKIHRRETFNSENQKSIHEDKQQDSTMALKKESVSHKDTQTLQKNGKENLEVKRSQEKLQVELNKSHEITNQMKMVSKDTTHVNNYKDQVSSIGEDVCTVVKHNQASFEAPKIHLEDIKVSTEEVSSNKEFMVGHKNQHEVIKRKTLQGKKVTVVAEHVGEKDFAELKKLPIKTLAAQNEPKTVDIMKGLCETAPKPLKRDCPSESEKPEINQQDALVQSQHIKVCDNKQPALNSEERKIEQPVLSKNGQKDGNLKVRNENRSSLEGKQVKHIEATETKQAHQPNTNQNQPGRGLEPEKERSASYELEHAQIYQKDAKKEGMLSKNEATQRNKKVTRPEISAIADYARLKVIAAEDDTKELDIFPKTDFYNSYDQPASRISKDSHRKVSGDIWEDSKREAILREKGQNLKQTPSLAQKHNPSTNIAEATPVSLVASGSQGRAASTQSRTPAIHRKSNTKQTLEQTKTGESYKTYQSRNPQGDNIAALQAESTINRSRQPAHDKRMEKTSFSHSGRQVLGNVKQADNQINMASPPEEEMEELQYYTVNALDIEPKPNYTPEPPHESPKIYQNKLEEDKKEDSLSLQSLTEYGKANMTGPRSNSSSPAMGKPTMFRVKDNTIRPSSVTKTVKPRFHRSFSDDLRIGSPKEHLSGSEKEDETHPKESANLPLLHEPAIVTQPLQKVKETLHNNMSIADYSTNKLKSYQRRSQHFEEEETRSVISTMSEDLENCTARPIDLADLSMAFMPKNEFYRDSYRRPASACYERPDSVCYERPESACSDIRSLGKPPAVPPKSEKALRRAQRLTTRRLKKSESPKLAPENQEQPEPKSISNISSVPSSPSDVPSSHQEVHASPPLSQYDTQPNYSPPAHSIVAQPFPMTQRKLLQDPNSGQYFMVDVPLPVKTKTFYDPETGKYVQLNVRQRSQGALTQPAQVEMLNAPYMLYRGFLPMAASSLSPLRSSSEMSTPAALTVHRDMLETGSEAWTQNVHHSRDSQQYPETQYGSHEQIHNPALYAENNVDDNDRHRDIITMSELEDFAMEST
ncbi:cardiac-enriched FHL2-interacting protein [Danio rerio]|uniref:Cardiac-enriched FHL2-interacting protein n=3 Tax=Danio rerio TaxID=7955 RepID=A0AC58H2M7_DANRE|nr:uncharacterized protein C10orf71 homolog [Danio rerio]|eukprot:XP_005157004.1 uncharacterized protein C10orf71 homolog [Danio rerio]